jgi:hypothetical protein
MLFEEVTKDTISNSDLMQSRAIRENLSRPAIYRQLVMFPGEISARKLAATA